MTTITVINPATAAAGPGPETGFDAAAYGGVVVFATNLAGAEAVDVVIGGGNAIVVCTKEDGTPLQLTAASPSAYLPGGACYVFVKPVTVGLCGVYASPRLP